MPLRGVAQQQFGGSLSDLDDVNDSVAPTEDSLLVGGGSEWEELPSPAGTNSFLNWNSLSGVNWLDATYFGWSTILSISSTTTGVSPTISTGDKLFFRDSGIYIHSAADGRMNLTADGYIDVAAPYIVNNGYILNNRPSSGSSQSLIQIDTGTNPTFGYQRVSSSDEWFTLGGSALYHRFCVRSDNVGDAIHTDGTRSMTYDASANTLELSNSSTGWIKPPAMTSTERDAMTPVAGAMIFNTTTSKHQGYDGSNWNDFY